MIDYRQLRAATQGTINARFQEVEQFRAHRINFFVIMKKAIELYLAGGGGNDKLLRQLQAYAQSLDDETAFDECDACLSGKDDRMQKAMEKKEEWRVKFN